MTTAQDLIQQGSRTALELSSDHLPSQIDHGLELHRESIVLSHGSAASAPSSCRCPQHRPRRWRPPRTPGSFRKYAHDPLDRRHRSARGTPPGLGSLRRTRILQNAGEEGNAPERLIKRLARYTYVIDTLDDLLLRASKPRDIIAAKEQDLHCFYMSCNGMPLPGDQVNVEEELRYIQVFSLGCRMMPCLQPPQQATAVVSYPSAAGLPTSAAPPSPK